MYARGFGEGADNEPVHASTTMPVSSLSKTLTAIAVLKLLEDGDLKMTDRVFGNKGILKLFGFSTIDGRMLDITVEHLLRHSAGWDEHKAPIYDPMLNKLYIARGYHVENIELQVKSKGDLSHYDIIKYMLRHPLAYTPGTKVRMSNFGYCILGRVVEEVSGVPYEDYIHRNILEPAGMMHTKIGSPMDLRDIPENLKGATVEIDSQLIHSLIDPELLDSTLGWYSSVYDISRLTISLMYPGANQLLKPETLERMFERPELSAMSHSHNWFGIGLQVRNDGAFWQESDQNDNDVIVFHAGLRAAFSASRKESVTDAFRKEDITMIAIMTNNRYKKLKSVMENLVPLIQQWPRENLQDASVRDLADARTLTDHDDLLVKLHLSEHSLMAYVNALRQAHYVPVWFHGYTESKSTHFVVISRKVHSIDALHYRLEISNNPRKLRSRIRQLELADDYEISFVQSYISASHDEDLTHLVLLNRSDTHTNNENKDDHHLTKTSIRWGLDTPLKEYLAKAGTLASKGFTIVAQSVSTHHHNASVDYIVKRKSVLDKSDHFAAYHDLTLKQLEETAKANALKEYNLEYLDTHLDRNTNTGPRFSAVFHKSKGAKWILQVGVQKASLVKEVSKWQGLGYVPRIIAGYVQDGMLYYTAMWLKP